MAARIQLPHGEADPRKRYSMPDPDSAVGAFDAVRRHRYSPAERPPTDEEVSAVLQLAEAYIHLTMYELGQEHCVGNLRDIWRARKARANTAEEVNDG